MIPQIRNIAILGSTGSIGRNTLEVVFAATNRFRVVGLSANQNLKQLCDQANRFQVAYVVATDTDRASKFDWSSLPPEMTVLYGQEGIETLVVAPEIDLVVAAIVGAAGLVGTWAALDAGKDVALANKETLVMAGPLVMALAQQRNAKILPVDSEHSAVFQALRSGHPKEVKRIILTASGGPFLRKTPQEIAEVTINEALTHPTWEMGPKITVDSATMMNKALEVVEARWLFDMPPERIEVVVHPQSIVHSMVEFKDGSVIAQLSPPDMRLPIQYALTYPDRWEGPATKLDFTQAMDLQFEPVDFTRFPALALGYEVARAGGTSGAVLNAANEAAVDGFLAGQIGFNDIVPACRAVLDHHDFDDTPTLKRLVELDVWARREVTRWVCA
ncbi:MAG: 1-deoxy-D-xylulose-5-phosphate reductoisomerase [Pirellulaceae bacterium]|jgi:1-deoxy-D-xylulose-5-phosphate reductoisomerase|nr:1-deoxy-D-xylulose-5-phosphate reductoisomerase [Pirellulaceae bacterium]